MASSSLKSSHKAEGLQVSCIQDRIEELNSSIKRVLEDKAQLESRNADLAQDLQASQDCLPGMSIY